MKIKQLIIVASAICLFYGCSYHEGYANGENIDSTITIFKASSESRDVGQTKTVLTEDGQIDWLPGDAIHIFKGQSDCGKFTTDITSQSASADFLGKVNYGDDDANKKYWAAYPYSDQNVCDGQSITVEIPDKQTAQSGSFDRSAFASIAVSDHTNLYFYNVCGGVKISVNNAVKQIVFRGNNDEIIAGNVNISLDQEGKPFVSSVNNGKKTITLQASDGGWLRPGCWYYIAALPTVLSTGYAIEIDRSDNANYDVKTLILNNSKVEIKRSIWGRLDDADDGSLYSIRPNNSTIVYSTEDGDVIEIPENVSSAVDTNYIDTNGYGIIVLKSGVENLNELFAETMVKEVYLPQSLESIGSGAFSGCAELKYISIPNSVTSIGDYAFKNCSSLTSITIPDSVTSIGAGVFYGCSALMGVTIPQGVTIIKDYAFWNCGSLTSITIPNGVASIGNSAFERCASLTNITIPNSVTSIGYFGFFECTKLSQITLSSRLSTISSYLFKGCSSLEELTIPYSVTRIENSAFESCVALKKVSIPNGVKSIGGAAFSYCSSLTEIAIPNGVTGIATGTFYECVSLRNITIPETVTSIGRNAFFNCSDLFINLNCVIECQSVFDGCKSYSITLGNNWTNISDVCFNCCTGLLSITMPDSITHIFSSAFSNCSNLSNVVISKKIVYIGALAFQGCSSLSSISVPNGVKTIGNAAFSSSGLTSIIIPESTTSIGDCAFKNCPLEIIRLLATTPPTCGKDAFLTNPQCEIVVPAGSLNLYLEKWPEYAGRIYPDA